MKKILITSQKTGVGKTTSAISLGTAAALSGVSTLLVDADPLNCIGAALDLAYHYDSPGLRGIGVDSKAPLWQNIVPNLDVTSPYGKDHQAIHSLDEFLILLHESTAFRRYQLVIFDTPNFLAAGQLRNLIRVSDEIILVIRAEPLTFQAIPNFTKLIRGVQEEGAQVRFRGLLLMLPPNEPLGGPWESELRQIFVTQLLPHAVPHDPAVQDSLNARKPLLTYRPTSVAARQYAKLAQHLGLASSETDQVDLFNTPQGQLSRLPIYQPVEDVPESNLSGTEVRKLLGEPVPELMESLSSIMQGIASQQKQTNQDTDRIRPITSTQSTQKTESDPNVNIGPIPAVLASYDVRVVPQQPERKMNPTPEKSLRGHTGDVTCVAFSPDGLTLATASWDKTVKLWHTSLGQERVTLRGHAGVVSSLAYAVGKDWLATASWDKTIRIWQASDGKPIIVLSGHTGVVTAVAFGPNGDFLVSGGWDRSIRIWDPQTGNALSVLEGHSRMVTSVAVSNDGQWIASGSWDKTARLWSRLGGTSKVLTGHIGDVSAVAFSPNGSLLATSSLDHTVRLWDVARGQEMALLRGHGGEVTSVAFSPDGRWLASTGWDKSVKVWDVSTGQVKLSLSGHTSVVTCVTFSHDGRFLASSSLDRTVRIWDLPAGNETSTLAVQLNNDSRPHASFNPRETPSKSMPTAEEINAHLFAVSKQTPLNQPRLNAAESIKSPEMDSQIPPPITTTISDGQVDLGVPPITPLIEDIFPRIQTKPVVYGEPSPEIPTSLPQTKLDLSDLPPVDDNQIQIRSSEVRTQSAASHANPLATEENLPNRKVTEHMVPVPSGEKVQAQVSEVVTEVKFPEISVSTEKSVEVKLSESSVPEVSVSKLEVQPPEIKFQMPKLEGNLHLLQKNPDPIPTTPEHQTLEIEVPKVELPSIKLPKVEVPELKAPSIKLPEIKVPDVVTSELADLKGTRPEIQAPKIESPEQPTVEISAPKSVVPQATLSESSQAAALPEIPKKVAIKLPDMRLNKGGGSPSKLSGASIPRPDLTQGNETTLPPSFGTVVNPEDLDEESIDFGYVPPPNQKGNLTQMSPSADQALPIPPEHLPKVEGVPPIPLPKVEVVRPTLSVETHPGKVEQVKAGQVEVVRPTLSVETPPPSPMNTNPPKPQPEQPISVATPMLKPKPKSGILSTTKTPTRLTELPTRGSAFSAMSYSSDGSLIAVARGDSTVLVFSVVSGELLQPLRGHAGDVHGTAFSPDGRLLATVGADTTIRVWELATGIEIRRLNGHLAQVVSVAFSPDGTRLATSSWDKTIKIWDWKSSFETKTLSGHTDGVASVAYSSDGTVLVSGGEDGTVRLWDLQTGKERLNIRGSSREICAVTISPENDRIASAGGEGSLRVWEVATGEESLSIVAHSRVTASLAFSPDSTMLVSGGWDHLVRIWNATNGQPVQLLRGHKAEVTGVTFSADGKGVISTGWDRTIRFWDIFTGIQTSTLSDDGLKPTEIAVAKGMRMTPRRLLGP